MTASCETAVLDPGDYTIRITSGTEAWTGTYGFYSWGPETTVDTPLTFGHAVTGELIGPATIHRHTFDLATASDLRFVYQRVGTVATLRDGSGAYIRSLSTSEPTRLSLDPGSYQVQITTTTAGTYSLRAELLDPADTFTLNLGDVVTDGQPSGAGNLETGTARDHYQLTIPTAQTVGLVLGCPNQLVSGDVWDENGFRRAELACDRPAVVSLTAGTYTLKTWTTSDGPATYQLEAVGEATADTFPIAVGDAIDPSIGAGAGTIETITSRDVYTFGLTEAAALVVDIGICDDLFTWRVETAAGATITEWLGCQNRLVSLGAGNFQLVVEANRGDGFYAGRTGSYTAALHPVPDPVIYPIAIGDTVAVDDPAPGAGILTAAHEVDTYTFTADTPTSAVIDLTGCNDIEWTLYGPSLEWIDSGHWCQPTPVDLPAGGEYRLDLTQTDTTTQAYSLAVRTDTIQTFAYQLGTVIDADDPEPGAGQIENGEAVDQYTFSLDAATDLFVDQPNCTEDVVVTLQVYDYPSWQYPSHEWECYQYDQRLIQLDRGDHRLQAVTYGDAPVTYQLAATPAVVTSYDVADVFTVGPAGADGTGALEGNTEIDRYRFSVDQAGDYIISLTPAAGDCTNTPYWAFEPADGTGWRRIGEACTHAKTVTASTVGEYHLDVYVDYGSTPGDYQLNVSRPPTPQEFTIIPDTAINDGNPAVGAGNIEQAGATDIYNFSITQPGYITLDPTMCIDSNLKLESATTTITQWNWQDPYSCHAKRLLLYPGPHRLTITGADASGPYSLDVTAE